MARRWLGRRACPNRARYSRPCRRQTSATAGLSGLRPPSRSAMRAVLVACTTSRVGGVRGVSRAVVRELWWPSSA
jgi:hypothetical protein